MADDVTRLLSEVTAGNAAAIDELAPIVYDELRRRAASYLRRERPEHTLQPTALVHEAYLRLVDQKKVDWKGRTHFVAVASEALRRILIDHARGKGRVKRGAAFRRVTLEGVAAPDDARDVDIVDLDAVLARLSELDPRASKVVELRFFGGLTEAEAAEALGVSPRTVRGDWAMARAWLQRELRGRVGA